LRRIDRVGGLRNCKGFDLKTQSAREIDTSGRFKLDQEDSLATEGGVGGQLVAVNIAQEENLDKRMPEFELEEISDGYNAEKEDGDPYDSWDNSKEPDVAFQPIHKSKANLVKDITSGELTTDRRLPSELERGLKSEERIHFSHPVEFYTSSNQQFGGYSPQMPQFAPYTNPNTV
jgi:hypothetical protein